MGTITKKDLIDRVALTTRIKRTVVKKAVQEFLDQIVEDLGKGHRLEFRDFGVFEIRERAPRTAQNPKTLERVKVPAKRTIKFKVGRKMREALDAGSSSNGVPVVEVRTQSLNSVNHAKNSLN